MFKWSRSAVVQDEKMKEVIRSRVDLFQHEVSAMQVSTVLDPEHETRAALLSLNTSEKRRDH